MKLLTFAVALFFFQQNSFASGLTFSTFHFPPYSNCQTSPVSGFDVELVRAVGADLSTPITIICLPWKRLLHRIRQGTVDGAFPALYLKAREQFARYVEVPLHTSSINIASKKGAGYKQLDQLEGKIIGIQAGFFLYPELHRRAKVERLAILETQGVLQNLKMLRRGRIDAYVDNHTVIDYFIKELQLGQFIHLSNTPVDDGAPAFLMLSRQSERALAQHEAISKALKKLSAVYSSQTLPPLIDK